MPQYVVQELNLKHVNVSTIINKKYQMSILSLPLSFQGHLKFCFITISMCAHMCYGTLKVRGQLSGAGSFLLSYEWVLKMELRVSGLC